jgi:hypothetical protein
MTKQYSPGIGWVCYGLVWLLLGANMVNDWLTQGWISPLILLILLILVCLISIPLVQRFAGKPGASTRRLRDPRVLLTYGIIALLLLGVVAYTVVLTGG